MANKRFYISSVFDKPIKYQLDEALGNEQNPSKVDGEFIIGRVEGPGFVPEGFSRNKRFYSRKLWENVLNDSDVRKNLENSTMFGCIGHSSGPVSEADLANGNVSHFVDALWIDPKTNLGMVRYYILNTPAGKNLKTYLKAGCQLKTSTRGEGDFLEGETRDNCPIINPDTYKLYTVDFVIEPGFVETGAELMEGYIEEVLIEDDQERGNDMSSFLEDSLAECQKERDALKIEVSEMLSEHSKETESLKNSCNELQEKLNTLQEEKSSVTKASKRAFAEKRKLAEALATMRSELSAYRELGTVKTIAKGTAIAESLLEEVSQYKELGSLTEVKRFKKQCSILEKQLKMYRKLGSLSEIARLIELSETYFTMKEKRTLTEKAKDLSLKYGRSIERIAESLSKKGEKKTITELEESRKEKEEKDLTKTVIVETVAPIEKEPEKTVSICESVFTDWVSKNMINEDNTEDEEDVLDSIDFGEVPLADLPYSDDEDEEEEADPLTRLDNLEDKVDELEDDLKDLKGEADDEEGDEEPEENPETEMEDEV